MDILRCENLTKSFGGFTAVNDVSLGFKEKQFTSIIGPNGAGKSTFFNLLSGRYKPTTGTLFLNRKTVTGLPAHEMSRLGLGRSFQITHIFPSITTFENMRLGVLANTGCCKHLFKSIDSFPEISDLTRHYLEMVGLDQVGDEIAGSLSYGNQRRLEIGLTLTGKPSVLLLDEPMAGMTPEETKVQTNVIREIADKESLTVLLIEHDMDVVFEVSDRIIVLQNGVVIADGSEEDIKSDKHVREAYLGDEVEC